MPPTDHYDEDSDEEGERDRKRYLKLGYAVAGVPRNKRHADRLKRQGLDEAAPASQQKATKSSDPVAPLVSYTSSSRNC